MAIAVARPYHFIRRRSRAERTVMNEIVLYGADWCPDCRRAKSFLDESGVAFDYRDTELDEAAVEMVEELTGGKRVIPTLQILGRTYVNPDNATLAVALGINPQGRASCTEPIGAPTAGAPRAISMTTTSNSSTSTSRNPMGRPGRSRGTTTVSGRSRRFSLATHGT
jgi:glutaredoxin